MKNLRYIVAVLSEALVGKPWACGELEAVMNLGLSSEEVQVLPLFVGSSLSQERALRDFPLLNHKLRLEWNGEAAPIVDELQRRLAE